MAAACLGGARGPLCGAREQVSARRVARHPVSAAGGSGSGVNQRQPHPAVPEDSALVAVSLKCALVAAAATAALAAAPQQASAAWEPRRHKTRHLDDRYTWWQRASPQAAQEQRGTTSRQPAKQATPTPPGAKRLAERMYHKLQQAIQGEGPVYSVGVSGRTPGAVAPRTTNDASPLGWVAVAVAAGAVALLTLGKRLRLPGGGGGSGQGGRWVRDRGMGGRMIWIQDGSTSSKPGSPRPLWEEDEETEQLAAQAQAQAAAAARGSTFSGASSGAPSAAAAANSKPEWWDPPSFPRYVPVSRQEELKRSARVMLRQLEDGKLLGGQDYSLEGLRELQELCQEAGGAQVKPATENGRDSMLRVGVRAAITSAQQGSPLMLGGQEPARFVCGLAHALGVPDARAVTITHAEVAAVCRAAFIDAEAAYRGGSQGEILDALLRVGTVLEALPLPLGSAEAELVAAGVVKQAASLQFRRDLFMAFGQLSTRAAPLVAEMLGFDPALVMPQLLMQLQSAAAAAGGASAGGTQPKPDS